MQINTWISGSEINLLFKRFSMTNYITLRTVLNCISFTLMKQQNPPTLENCGQIDILETDASVAGWILSIYISPAFISLIYTKEKFSFSVSSNRIFLNIQSWALRWKKSPSSTACEWSCEIVVDSVLLISKSPSLQSLSLCWTPLMLADFSGVCKY